MDSNYLRRYSEWFWDWEEENSVVAIPEGSTIAFKQELITIFEGFEGQGLPPFGALLLVIVALNERARHDLDYIMTIVKTAGVEGGYCEQGMLF